MKEKQFLVVLLGVIFFAFFASPFIFNNHKKTQKQVIITPLPRASENITNSGTSLGIKTTTVKVTRVIDGDTIEIEGGQKVRYIGIDTPETVDPRKPLQCFGKEAAAKNRELVGGKDVSLEKDVSETDKYGRLLRYVFVNETFINDVLVRQGFAHSSTFLPDVKYQQDFNEAEGEARQYNRGLWSSCQGTNGTSTLPTADNQGQEGCVIKGNISSSGEKIYHMLGQRYYDKTQIDDSKGERWFCTEEEAQIAGWRKSKI